MIYTAAADSNHSINPNILREYDIRGIVGDSLTPDNAWHIGRAFGAITRKNSGKEVPDICVGYDGRTTSPELENALIDGLVKSGTNAIRIGCGPTPMLYYSVYKTNADAGIMVTGSHNPPTHNGFKFMLGKRAFFGAAIKQLGEMIASGEYASGNGNTTNRNEIQEQYINRLVSAYGTHKRDLTIAWDAGNGAAGTIVQQLCEHLPGTHIPLFTEIDGSFPNHHPDPTVAENLTQLIDAVRSEQCDVGIAFDGDGDRIGIVDNNGEILWADQLLLLYAEDVLKTHPSSTIIADVKASQSLFDGISAQGGEPLMWKTGHSHIKSKMLETSAPLAGEMSGHIFFADEYYGFDDGLYAAIRLLRILNENNQSLSQWRKTLPESFATPEIRFPCPEEHKFAIINEVAVRLNASGATFSTIDGVRVDTADGWWLLRASNTQAALSARCEAKTEEGLVKLKEDLCTQLAKSDVALPDNN